MEIGIRELKDRLSEILHRAHAGEKITITHHGRPLCEISPTEVTQVKRPAYLTKGIEEGWLTPAKVHTRQIVKPIKARKTGKSTTELLRESRAERF
ncbi:MAG TPA: type II toxin-antitoxin system prevent-host-death family antitoxin [Candidatus Paceibacterota bacterium]|nr:type II toxin-antitoxin system prevent-host-death family antitoxin [Candidatus Paceibacterota bacterium]